MAVFLFYTHELMHLSVTSLKHCFVNHKVLVFRVLLYLTKFTYNFVSIRRYSVISGDMRWLVSAAECLQHQFYCCYFCVI